MKIAVSQLIDSIPDKKKKNPMKVKDVIRLVQLMDSSRASNTISKSLNDNYSKSGKPGFYDISKKTSSGLSKIILPPAYNDVYTRINSSSKAGKNLKLKHDFSKEQIMDLYALQNGVDGYNTDKMLNFNELDTLDIISGDRLNSDVGYLFAKTGKREIKNVVLTTISNNYYKNDKSVESWYEHVLSNPTRFKLHPMVEYRIQMLLGA